MNLILRYIASLIENLPPPEQIAFTPTRNPDKGTIRFKVTMGIMPDYAFEGKGLKIDGVTEGKPAHKAGIKQGDILVEMNKKKINSVQDYMKLLSELEKGQMVPAKIIRNNKEIIIKIQF